MITDIQDHEIQDYLRFAFLRHRKIKLHPAYFPELKPALGADADPVDRDFELRKIVDGLPVVSQTDLQIVGKNPCGRGSGDGESK